MAQQYLDKSFYVPGLKCDGCGIEASPTLKLLKCAKCARKFYCGKECQSIDWSHGKHKKSCRLPKDFKVNDLVLLRNIKSIPEVNGQIFTIVGPAETLGRWEVAFIGVDKAISVSDQNLVLVLPKEERVDLDGPQ